MWWGWVTPRPTGGVVPANPKELTVSIDVATWYQAHGPMVYRRCRQLLRDEELAEEAMHDVFVQVVRREDRLRDEAPVSLLYRMATNVSLNLIRSKRRRPEDAETDLVHRIACLPDHESEVGARTLLDRLFGREPESTRVIATLHLADGMTLEETAEAVGMSVSGVRKRLRKLKASLVALEEAA